MMPNRASVKKVAQCHLNCPIQPISRAIDSKLTLIEARRLLQAVRWSNLMLKIPATAANTSDCTTHLRRVSQIEDLKSAVKKM